MLMNEPPESAYDLRFELLGIPVRIAWSFWLVALIFGYGSAQYADYLFQKTSPGMLFFLLLWISVMFVSILIHEMGHALAFRLSGINSVVVLYHFGGLAIPLSSREVGLSAMRLSRNENIVIAAAGPLAQIAIAAITVLLLTVTGYSLWGGEFVAGEKLYVTPAGPEFLAKSLGIDRGEPITSPGLFALVNFTLFINIWWALLNLIPVWPLDGGRIAREVIGKFGGSTYQATQVSLVIAGLVALWMFGNQQTFAGFLFLSLAIGSYQMLESMGGWRF